MGLERYVVDAVLIEKRSPTEIARAHGISRSWLYALLARLGPELEGETLRRLTEAIPNEAERAGVLLRWFSVGNAEWPGQPAHEGIPGNLLLEMRTDRTVDFLANGSPEERHWVGALRLITGWKFGARKRDDLRLLTPIREGLLDAAQRLGDPEVTRQKREQVATLIPPN
jgi:hypothetical protein